MQVSRIGLCVQVSRIGLCVQVSRIVSVCRCLG